MTFLDARTEFLMLGLLYLLLPTVTWIVLAGQRTIQVGLWCGGGLLVGNASILVGLHDIVPEWVYITLATVMYRVAFLLRIQSLRLDLGIPWRWRWMAFAEIVVLLIFLNIHYGLQDYVLRAQFNSVVMAGLLFHLATLAWRIGCDEQSRSAKWIAWVYGLVTAVMLFRFVAVADRSGNFNILDEGLTAQLLAMSLLLASVVGHFGYVGLALDRSMRRELKAADFRARDEENQRLGAQIAQLDRQRSLGELAASLGHELNQPLTAILTNAQVAKRGLQSGRFDAVQHTEFLDKIVHNTQRASQIIERIRSFIRPSASRSEPVDLNMIVREVTELVADEARRSKVRFVFSANTGQMLVTGDPIQLSQIVLNAFRNAIEALKQTTQREIQVSCRYSNERVILIIRDTGPGLTPEALDQAGTPFFTTKSTGLGMGISISRSIAMQHGGTLTLTNADAQDGGGAIVELNLPALPEVNQ